MRELVSFEVVPGDPTSAYIVYVPHSSIRIPDDVRPQLLLDDDALAEELRLMTDARTDELATAGRRAGRAPAVVVREPPFAPGRGPRATAQRG